MAIIEFVVDLQDYVVELEQYVVDDYVEEGGSKSSTVINGGKLIEATPTFDSLFNSSSIVEITRNIAVTTTTTATMTISGVYTASADITLESIVNVSLMAVKTTDTSLDTLSEAGFLLPQVNTTKVSSVDMQTEFTGLFVTDVFDEGGVISFPSVVQGFELDITSRFTSTIQPISYTARGTRTLESPLLPYRISYDGSFNTETLVPEYEKYTVGGDKFLYDAFNNTETASLPFPEKFALLTQLNNVRFINTQDFYVSFEYNAASYSASNSVIFRLSNTNNNPNYSGAANTPSRNDADPLTLVVNTGGNFELFFKNNIGAPLFQDLTFSLICGPATNSVITVYQNSGGLFVKIDDTIVASTTRSDNRIVINQIQLYTHGLEPYTFDNLIFKIGTDENGVPGVTQTDSRTVAYYSFDGTLNDTNNFDATGELIVDATFTEVVEGQTIINATVDFDSISTVASIANQIGNTLTDFETAFITMDVTANATSSGNVEVSVVTLFDSNISAIYSQDVTATSAFQDVITANRTRDINTIAVASFTLEGSLNDLLDKLAASVVYVVPSEAREYTIPTEIRAYHIDAQQ